jgi:hypothetical protein
MLSAAVMAHPRRAAMVEALLGELDRPVPVVWDQINDRHDTGVRALEAYDPAASHHLVIQDDTMTCRDLLAGVERALRYVPQDVPLCLYLGRVRPFRSVVEQAVQRAARGASWVTMQGIYWGPAIVVPTAHLPELTSWFRSATVKNYDRRVSAWYCLQRTTVFYPWPSLVDHHDTESLVPGHGGGRHAHAFLGVDRSALEVDWTGAVVDVPRSARMDNARQVQAVRAARKVGAQATSRR